MGEGRHHCQVEEKVPLQILSLQQLLSSRGLTARVGCPIAPATIELENYWQMNWIQVYWKELRIDKLIDITGCTVLADEGCFT